MRTLPLILFWSILLYSCKEVSFRTAQPVGVPALKEVPEALRGSYQMHDPSNGELTDTLIIESWGYHMKDKKDVDWLNRGTISDSLVIKFYQDYYFVNFRVGDQWILRLIKQAPDGSIEYLGIDIQDDATGKEKLKKLSKKVKITEVKRKEDTFYQINPTQQQLMALIKEGYFSRIRMQKIK